MTVPKTEKGTAYHYGICDQIIIPIVDLAVGLKFEPCILAAVMICAHVLFSIFLSYEVKKIEVNMDKQVDKDIMISFRNIYHKKETLSDYKNYYSALVIWVKNHIDLFTKEQLENSRYKH